MVPEKIKELLKKNGQEHLTGFCGELGDEERKALFKQIEGIDFEKVTELYKSASSEHTESGGEYCYEPLGYTEKAGLTPDERNELERIGGEIIANGGFAALTMAGGQGTRLGHDGPKGTYDIGLPGHPSLFEIQCSRLAAASAKYGKTIPWYIMTSRENDKATRKFFREHSFFGYPEEDIVFFVQNMLPMVAFDGKIVLDEKGHVKEGADGHGGVFAALKSSGCYDDMKRRGIKWIFIGGIDNVLLKLCDPLFIGFGESSGAKIAAKSLVKRDAKEGVGVFCRRNGKPYVIEYTEISDEMADMRNGDGSFVYGDAHVLCNLFSIEAVAAVIGENSGLPYHVARKKTKFVNEKGETIVPEKPNAYKFEAFIFDAFEMFDDLAILRVDRESEFAPVKNKEGEDSPESARRMYEENLRRNEQR
ncbi:MAG: UDPGP type 1 family protein [Clostridia bacterium]|nr:UDPGP type 1 family protein [Clostridia bacterium]